MSKENYIVLDGENYSLYKDHIRDMFVLHIHDTQTSKEKEYETTLFWQEVLARIAVAAGNVYLSCSCLYPIGTEVHVVGGRMVYKVTGKFGIGA